MPKPPKTKKFKKIAYLIHVPKVRTTCLMSNRTHPPIIIQKSNVVIIQNLLFSLRLTTCLT